jgi:hypothetical protein
VDREDMTALMFKMKESKLLRFINKIIRFKALDCWKMKKVISQLITEKMRSRITEPGVQKCAEK